MLMIYYLLCLATLMLMRTQNSDSLRFPVAFQTRMRKPSSQKLHLMHTDFLVSVVEKGDGYVYGAVSAPDWALPLGAFLVILTAGIPILLKPGEKALDEQRENEEKTNNPFNKRQNKDLR